LSTTGATIDVAARIIKLNISRKEETFTFKPKGTEKCNQVIVTIRPERNAMTLDKKANVAENFSMKFSRRVKNATTVVTSRTRKLIFKGMETVLLVDYKCEALTGR
jgi:protoporphyrinogen oxidase